MPFIVATGIVMFLAVALGAFGAHGLKDTLVANGRLEVWATAAHYQLVHGLALLAIGIWRRCDIVAGASHALCAAGICWVAGIALFSGSLYWLSLGGPKWLGPVTPLGGLSFLAGWVLLTIAAAKGGGRQ